MDCGIHPSLTRNSSRLTSPVPHHEKETFRESLAYMAVFESKQHKDLLPSTSLAATAIERAMSWNQQCFRREKQQALT
jgi:hypothetical protein